MARYENGNPRESDAPGLKIEPLPPNMFPSGAQIMHIRVARAMCYAEAAHYDVHESDRAEKWRYEYVIWMYRARAALMALREPTEAMHLAGIESRDSGAGGSISEIWRAMVNAATLEVER